MVKQKHLNIREAMQIIGQESPTARARYSLHSLHITQVQLAPEAGYTLFKKLCDFRMTFKYLLITALIFKKHENAFCFVNFF